MAIRFDMTVTSGNAAFTDNPEGEMARILTELAEDVRKGRSGSFTLRDINGNAVGSAWFEIGDGEA